jgi:hypothetical protein
MSARVDDLGYRETGRSDAPADGSWLTLRPVPTELQPVEPCDPARLLPSAFGAWTAFPTDSKQADPRWRWYRQRYGPRCWELDALDPRVLRDRVAAAIEPGAWARCARAEAVERESIHGVLTEWRRRISRQAQE